jgi:CheY-like chemotaxis protein
MRFAIDTSLESAGRYKSPLPSLAGDVVVEQKLLIVEDNHMVREMFALALSEAGFSVITADDGYAGLDCARAERPDLILTDIEMPNLDGIQMIEHLRQEPELERIPVLVLSAVHVGLLQQAVAVGAREVIQKPVQLTVLIQMIKQTLGTTLSVMAALSMLLNIT